MYRILHLPTFRKEFEALWVTENSPDVGFLTQLKLVLALGAVTYDDQFSLRTCATGWVYQAEVSLAEPKFKLQLNIQSLQSNILLLFAQERLGISQDSIWVSSGTILRKAMQMGLHIDPSRLPIRSAYTSEMRRRLWNTILELNLHSSLTSGGAPLLSLSDFNAGPPGNFDDEQIEADEPVCKPPEVYTQISIALAMRQTFPQRLAIVKFLNDPRTSVGTYEETLRLDAELRKAYKDLKKTLSAAYSNSSSSSRNASSEIQLVDFLMHRYFLSLHAPYFGPALMNDTQYAYSQKTVIESSLRLWRAACPAPAPYPITFQPGDNRIMSDLEPDIPRLASCSSGFYPTVAFHAALLIALELRSQLQEKDQYSFLGPTHLRPDLVSVLEDARAWCLRVIEAGETNVKGYLLISLVAVQVNGMMKDLSEDEIADGLIQTVLGVEESCLPLLERAAERMGSESIEGRPVDDMMGELPVSLDMGQGTETWAMNWIMNDDLDIGDLMF
jgi:hypothetical protein